MRNCVFQCIVLFFGQAVFQVSPSGSYADESAALSAIYAEEHVPGGALSVHWKAMRLPPVPRFQMLSKWVLPNKDHSTLRLQVAFVAADHGPLDVLDDIRGGTVSPFLDLVATAVELNRLEDLRRTITDLRIDDPWQVQSAYAAELSQQIALTLIEVADQKFPQAETHMERILQMVLQDRPQPNINTEEPNAQRSNLQAAADSENQWTVASLEPSDEIILLATRTSETPQLRELTARLLSRFDKWIKDKYEPDARRRHVMALIYRMWAVEASQAAGTNVVDAGSTMSQWRPVSRITAVSHGTGNPDPQWLFSPQQVELVSPHERDFLYFHSPLQGNYDVECDISVESWSIASVMVSGYWLGPIYTQNGFDTGCFRWQGPRVHFDPSLTKCRSWMRYRTTVRDGVVTTYFNGRPVQARPAEGYHDPWIAIRSNPRDHGKVRDFRISGSPVIPKQIELLNDSGLSFWFAYFGESVGDPGDHWVMAEGVLHAQNDFTLRAAEVDLLTKSVDFPGEACWDERLLQYHRPMMEDGVIAFDFFYSPGKVCVHPALDRLAFLVGENGVQLHEITDGAFDRTERSPASILDVPKARRGPEPIPLKPNDWNRMELHVTGDVVSLVLNNAEIFEWTLERGNRRTFGLFHFADRTSAKVRNMVWSGNWPTELPSISDQEMAIPEAESLDADSARLIVGYHHDFGTEGLPVDRFRAMSGNMGTHLTVTSEGLVAQREGMGGYLNATVAPTLVVSGDFDAIAEYEGFDTSSDATGSGTIALITMLDNDSQDEFLVFRRHMARANSLVEQILQCAVVRRLPDGERRNYFVTEPMEETSGRLRLSRRGELMYFLTAENDSSNFRVRGKHPVTTDDLKIDGLRLMTQIHQKGGTVRVVWKSLSVRAEAVGSSTQLSSAELVRSLDQQQDKLGDHLINDFRQKPPTAEQFYLWNIPDEWKKDDKGLLIRSIGADVWTSAGVSSYTHLTGDFDATIRFRPEQLATPKEGQHTQIYLQIEAPDEQRTQVNSVYTLNSEGETIAEARVRTRNQKGDYNYLGLGKLGMKPCCRLRIARRGTKVTFLAAEKADSPDEVIADYQFSGLPILPASVRIMVHTGGDERESRVILESLELHAATISQSAGPVLLPSPNSPNLPDSRNPMPQTPPARSLLDRILDSFRGQ